MQILKEGDKAAVKAINSSVKNQWSNPYSLPLQKMDLPNTR